MIIMLLPKASVSRTRCGRVTYYPCIILIITIMLIIITIMFMAPFGRTTRMHCLGTHSIHE